ncbi:MAG: hypothetical protein Q4D16_25040 [Eubacteriales bacterium]|nr:hypothetical protein [Eubacteriales bacterium]
MEEQKREEMQEGNDSGFEENTFPAEKEDASRDTDQNSQDIVDAGEDNSAAEEEAPAGLPTRSLMLMVLAGIYLLYTGYRLCKNVIDGVEGASIGFMLAGIAFFIIGAGMLFIGGRGVFRADKLKKAQEAAAAAQEAQQPKPAEDTSSEAAQEAGKKMSISERARLASKLEDEEEE